MCVAFDCISTFVVPTPCVNWSVEDITQLPCRKRQTFYFVFFIGCTRNINRIIRILGQIFILNRPIEKAFDDNEVIPQCFWSDAFRRVFLSPVLYLSIRCMYQVCCARCFSWWTVTVRRHVASLPSLRNAPFYLCPRSLVKYGFSCWHGFWDRRTCSCGNSGCCTPPPMRPMSYRVLTAFLTTSEKKRYSPQSVPKGRPQLSFADQTTESSRYIQYRIIRCPTIIKAHRYLRNSKGVY